MSTLLYRLGKSSYAHPGRVIGVWLLVLAAIVGSLLLNAPRLSSELRIEGTPAQEVIDQLATDLPEAAGGQGAVVFQAPDGASFFADDQLAGALVQAAGAIYAHDEVIDPAELAGNGPEQEAALAQMVEQAEQAAQAAAAGMELDQPVPLVVGGNLVPGMIVAPGGDVALLQFQFTQQTFDLPAGTIDEVVEAAEAAAESAGIAVLPGGSLQELPEVIGVGEILGLVVAAIVLVITLGSLVAAGLPLLNALVGVGVGVGGAFALSHFFELTSISVVLGLMLGLAVGIDYALFVVNRQRQLILTQKLAAREAAGRAVGTAGSAVFFAGTTVVIALLGMLVIGISLLSTMALIAAATVAMAVLVSLTLLPAMLGLVKERIVGQTARQRHDERTANGHRTPARWWASVITGRPILTTLTVVIVALVVAIPALDMRFGLPAGDAYNEGTPQRESYEVVSEAFGEGMNGPLLVVLTSEGEQPLDEQAIGAVLMDIGERDAVAVASAAGVSQDGRVVMLSVTPVEGPTDESTEALVHELRGDSAAVAAGVGATLGVTGQTAMGIDIADRMAEVLPVYLAVVVLLSLVVLTLMFRSVLVPLKATVGFVLTILATLGVTTAVFQWGWLSGLFGLDSTGPVMALLPVLVTGVAYGLAMDYQVFLVSSMRESWVHGHRGASSVVDGFTHSSRVVVAAAIIMISVFAGFIFNADPMIKQIGFALAAAIAIDAFLVRMTLVPAVMAMFGDRAWRLPRWLDRILPDLDVEGDKLTRRLAGRAGETPGT